MWDYAYRAIANLRHSNGAPLVEFYGRHEAHDPSIQARAAGETQAGFTLLPSLGHRAHTSSLCGLSPVWHQWVTAGEGKVCGGNARKAGVLSKKRASAVATNRQSGDNSRKPTAEQARAQHPEVIEEEV